MNLVVRTLGAVVVAVLFVFVIGYLEFREDMLELGLVMTWDLVPLSATTPEVAYLEKIALFVLFGIVTLLFLMQRRGLSGHTGVPALVGGLTLVAIAGWYMAMVDRGVALPVEMNEPTEEFGWAAAFETGALSSAVLGMAALLLVIGILRLVSAGNSTAEATSDDERLR